MVSFSRLDRLFFKPLKIYPQINKCVQATVTRVVDSMEILSKINKILNYHTNSLKNNKCLFLLLFFLFAVVIVAFIVPNGLFGRLFGTDEYTHLYHTQEMFVSNSLSEFYVKMGEKVSVPNSPDNPFEYPFGLWFFAAIVAKVTGIPITETALLYSLVFVVVLLSSYYFYLNAFIKRNTQKILGILFLLSMPVISMNITGYRPEVFTLPLVFILIYFALFDEIKLRYLAILGLLTFILVISHTGTFLFLLAFSIVYILIYSLIWGKFPKMMYVLAASMLFIYVLTIRIFTHIHPQYITKATLFMMPGTFLAKHFYIFFADDLSYVLYTNIFVQNDFAYAIFWSALILAGAVVFLQVHKEFERGLHFLKGFSQISLLPTRGLSKGWLSTPLWTGPIHVFLSLVGVFFLESQGMCVLIATGITSVVPGYLEQTGGVIGATGSLREIVYLIIIIPIVSVAGFEFILSKLKALPRLNKISSFTFIFLIFLSMIIVPAIGDAYYNPIVSGEDYTIRGLQWLSTIGNPGEKVTGYGLRPTPVYTQKDEAGYGISRGTAVRYYEKLLNNIFFISDPQSAEDLSFAFGSRYIISSDKIVQDLGGNRSKVRIDSNQALDKIYSSRDFGVYDNPISVENSSSYQYLTGNISMKQSGSGLALIAPNYKVIIDLNSPTIKFIGTAQDNYLSEGYFVDYMRIDFFEGSQNLIFIDPTFSREMHDNRLTYYKVVQNGENKWATVSVKYTFYPDTIRREYTISNDWYNTSFPMRLYLSSQVIMPMTDIVIKNGPKRIERTISPLEDSVPIPEIYQYLYLMNNNQGICINYEATAPFPNSVSYQGSTTYTEYGIAATDQNEGLVPGASATFTQYISIGDEKSIESRIEKQKKISLAPYPEGMNPLIIIPYANLTFSNYFLSEIDQLDEEGRPFIMAGGINSPIQGAFDEGLRHPQMAVYNGNTTNIVILPVSEPQSSILSRSSNVTSVFSQWMNVLNSVAKNDDMALFIFRPEDVRNPKYSENFLELFEYARQLGVTNSSPDKIADHFKKLQKISYNASQDGDSASISLTNSNDQEVDGVTFKIQLPILETGSYRIENGRLVRTKLEGDQVLLYVATDISAHESKNILVVPSEERKKLSIEVAQYPIVGPVRVYILDDKQNTLPKTTVTIDGTLYMTDKNGMVEVDLDRGFHEVMAFKPGYDKASRTIEVNGRLYMLLKYYSKVINHTS